MHRFKDIATGAEKSLPQKSLLTHYRGVVRVIRLPRTCVHFANMMQAKCLMLWVICCMSASGNDPVPLTTQQFLRSGESGRWQLWTELTVIKTQSRQRTVTKKIPEMVTVTQEVDGKVEEKTVTTYKDVTESQTYTVCIPLRNPVSRTVQNSALRAREIDGRAIALDSLRRRVGDGTLVVVYGTSGPLPESYKDLFKAGTIVITVEEANDHEIPASPAGSEHPSAAVASPPEFPGKPAPLFVMLSRSGVHDVMVRRTSESTGPIKAPVANTDNASAEPTLVPVMRTIRESETFVFAHQDLRFHTGQSRDLPLEQISERIARETAVVYYGDGETIDPFWRQNLKPTAMIVTGPQLPGARDLSVPVAVPMAIPLPVVPALPAPLPTPNEPMPIIPSSPDAALRDQKERPGEDLNLSGVEVDVVRRVNRAREEARLAPLRCEASVTMAARGHAEQMAKTKILAHELNGQGVGDRLEKAGIQWVQCGENIACGQTTPEEAFDSWMKSPGHRANIMKAEYSRIGVAVATDSTGQKYWTMVLARLL